MSRKLETTEALYEAFMSGDLDGMLALLDDDVEWEVTPFLTGQGSFRGKDEVRKWMGDAAAKAESGNETLVPTFTRDEELDDGRLLRLGHFKLLRPEDPIESEYAVIYSFRGDAISRLEVFMSHDEALREAGLES